MATVQLGFSQQIGGTNAFLDFDAGTDGVQCTNATLTASLHISGSWLTITTNTANAFDSYIFSAAGQRGLTGVDFIKDLGRFGGNGSVGLRCELTNNMGLKWTSTFSSPKFSVGWWFKGTVTPETLAYIDSMFIQEDQSLNGPGGYANAAILSGAGGYKIGLETGGVGTSESTGRYATNVFWWLTMVYNKDGNNMLSIYNSNMVFQETLISNGNRAGATNSAQGIFGSAILGQSSPGLYLYFDSIIFDPNGNFPLLPQNPHHVVQGGNSIQSTVFKQ